jgi:hypothetical protein
MSVFGSLRTGILNGRPIEGSAKPREGKLMKRILIASFASLLLLALAAPAQGATKMRFFEGKVAGGGQVQFGVELLVRYKMDGQRSRNRFIPHRVDYFEFHIVPVSCNEDDTFLTETRDTSIKIKKGQWTYVHPDGTGRFAGEMRKKGTRATGIYKRRNVDFPTSGLTDCTTQGPRSWSAHRCRRGDGNPSVPVCRVGGGS